MNEVRYLRQPAERRRCPPIGGRLSLPYFSSARLASPFAEIGRNPRRDRSYSESRSVHFRPEIGRNPCRDRSASGSKSVVLHVEIGPPPARDRSHSAPKSVHLRLEIGRTPHRNRSASGSKSVLKSANIRSGEPCPSGHRSRCRSPLGRVIGTSVATSRTWLRLPDGRSLPNHAKTGTWASFTSA